MKMNLFNNNDLECILEQDKANKKGKKIKIVKKQTQRITKKELDNYETERELILNDNDSENDNQIDSALLKNR
jgi:hypothetical protein